MDININIDLKLDFISIYIISSYETHQQLRKWNIN